MSIVPMIVPVVSACRGRDIDSPMVRMVHSIAPVAIAGRTFARSLSNAVVTSKSSLAKYPSFCATNTGAKPNQNGKIQFILSPALGGIVVGYEVGRQLNIETIFAERVNGKFLAKTSS